MLGTALLDRSANFSGALPPVASAYRERLVEKMAELVADMAAVKTTKFKMAAADVTPIPVKT